MEVKAPVQQPECGMTLVEMIVALTITAFASLSLFSAFHSAGKMRSTALMNSMHLNRVIATQNFLRTQLMRAVVLNCEEDLADIEICFEHGGLSGSDAEIMFVSPWLNHIGQGRLFRFKLQVTGSNLMVTWRPAKRSKSVSGDAEIRGSRVLLGDVSELSVDFFGEGWQQVWSDRHRLPNMIRIRVKFYDDRYWPALVVSLAS